MRLQGQCVGITGIQGQRLIHAFEGGGRAVQPFVMPGPADFNPGILGRFVAGLLQPFLGAGEIPKVTVQSAFQRCGVARYSGTGDMTTGLLQIGQGCPGTATARANPQHVVMGLGMSGVPSPGPQDKSFSPGGIAEKPNRPAGQDPLVGIGPRLGRASFFPGVPERKEGALFVPGQTLGLRDGI